jgi:hypothetical protein
VLPAYSTPERVLDQWAKGRLGRGEFYFRLLQTVNNANVEEFLAVVPADILAEIRETVQLAPRTDREWGRTVYIRTWCGPWNDEIESRLRQEETEESQRYREGVETLRAYLFRGDCPSGKS